MAWVRVSCHTIALWIGCPVARSHTTVVSRWLVMPTAAMWVALRLALPSAPPTTARVFCQISMGSCSTQPARGKTCRCSSWSTATTWPPRSNTMARVLVVPWSIATTWLRCSVGMSPTVPRESTPVTRVLMCLWTALWHRGFRVHRPDRALDLHSNTCSNRGRWPSGERRASMPYVDASPAAGGDGRLARVRQIFRADRERREVRVMAAPVGFRDERLDACGDRVLSQVEALERAKARLEARLLAAYAALHTIQDQQLARLTTSTPVPLTAERLVTAEIACATGVGAGEVSRRLELALA